jgi:lysozyme
MIEGIDVSRYERVIDWAAVKAAGYAFMYTRATVGDYYTDPTFKSTYTEDGVSFGYYWAGAKSAGLPRGAYHVIAPWRPKEQINKFIDLLLGDVGECPPCLDLEIFNYLESWWLANKALTTECLRHAVVEIKARLGVTPMIYTSKYYATIINRNAEIESCPLWVASYTTKPVPYMPIQWGAWKVWQYSEAGKIPGIVGATDLNWAQDNFIPGTVIPVEKTDKEKLDLLWGEHPNLH